MCTVIYLPQKDGPMFVSSRDENPARLTFAPKIRLQRDVNILCPQDEEKGGTWIGTNEKGSAVILLNGGFENHVRAGSYKQSRGTIVSGLLAETDIVNAWNCQTLLDIEPFTLVVWYANRLYQLTWDGRAKHTQQMNAQKPMIWSSSTLYDAQAKALRATWFNEILDKRFEVNEETLFNFLHQHNDRQNGFVMHRSDVLRTISISIMRFKIDNVQFIYHNLLNGTNTIEDLKLSNNSNAYELEDILYKNQALGILEQ
jgi:uncharacterized protein with NRDE domain